jgi:putative membrane protein
MTTLFFLLAFFFAQIGIQNRDPVPANPAPTKYAASPDTDHLFAIAATEGNNAEVDLAQLALQHGHAAEVLSFANKMIYEHEALMKQFQPVISRLLPAGVPERLSTADTLASRHLASVPAVNFDQEYLTGQIAAHLMTLTAFQAEADNGVDPELKELARKWLPTIKSHLELAVDLTKHIGGSSPFKT